jgi:hypothetical protein
MAIVGSGSIASVIEDREGFTFFACGESNRFEFSQQRAGNEMLRFCRFIHEPTMLVYFSGLNIYYKDSVKRNDYTQHKLNMEAFVKKQDNYCIIRLGSIMWGDNPNTLLNALKSKIKDNPEYLGEPVYRYLNSKEEVAHWCNMIPEKGKHEMNITGRLVFVPDLVKEIKEGKI